MENNNYVKLNNDIIIVLNDNILTFKNLKTGYSSSLEVKLYSCFRFPSDFNRNILAYITAFEKEHLLDSFNLTYMHLFDGIHCFKKLNDKEIVIFAKEEYIPHIIGYKGRNIMKLKWIYNLRKITVKKEK